MGYWDDVNPRSVSEASDGFSEFALGDNEAFIDEVKEKMSESGNEMLVVTFAKSNGATIKYFIVDGEWKLSKLKQLYAAFDIPIGETDTKKWLGKTGIVVCKEGKPYNGKVYNQVSYVKPKNVNSRPPQAANYGNTNHSTNTQPHEPSDDIPPDDKEFLDDIPF